MAKQQVQANDRHLRVAYVWNGTLQAEDTLRAQRPVVLGGAKNAFFALPDNIGVDEVTLLEPAGAGYQLKLTPNMAGDVWVGGSRRSVRDLASSTSSVPLGPDDYGVVTLGTIAVFFQHVRAARELPRAFLAFPAALFASISLSVFIHVALAVLFFLIIREFPERDPLELPPDLQARFLVTPPPEDILEELRESGTNTEDPGLQTRDETGGERHEGDEGRVGREDAPQEDTEIEGEVTGEVAAQVRQMGLLGVLSGGGEENVIADALDVPDISDILGGTGAARTLVGRGSGGTGLRGTGMGGGGDGPGSLFGAGDIGMGIGAGMGGLGMGMGGIGVMGRPSMERTVTVTRGAPRVSGYLSPEQINRVVRANSAAIRYCYEIEVQRQPNLRGRVSIQWRINLQGGVTTARVASSSLGNASVEGCIVRQVRRWRFPQPDGGEVSVTYPFIFGVQGG
ncbi:MAG: AgmX/PglI C-terminal domain-containing protein [Myxococcota bacterium]